MAIAFAHVSIHSRSKGHSAVAAAAYRAGIKLYDERLGKTYDYRNRDDVQFTEILLPEGSDAKFMEREFLWNEAERAESRKNSQVSKDFVLALPKEMDLIYQIELAKRFAQVHFVDNGIPADIAIHDHGDGNPHAHILVTTRRLKGDRFDTHKARDLNPVFGRGYIKEEDHWNDQWRDFQNNYFEEKGFDLSVDFDHVVPEKHHGGHRNTANHYIRQENEIIKEVRQDIALYDIDNFINIVSIEHSVFTRRDIEVLLFKTIEKENYQEFFQVTVERILSNENVVCLGENEQGQKAYTTRNQFVQECKLLRHVEAIQSRQRHVFKADIAAYLEKTTLSEEQKQAFEFVVSGGDISCIIGRPGVGKSYMLLPVKSFYESHGCRVLGAALSGKVAKQLQAESGIKSSTIASLTARILSGKLALTAKDILVIDEAGMVDFANMSFLVEKVKEAGAKMILVGDPDQLKPIKKGAIFRGIADHVGCFTMVDIKRQRHEGDRKASIALAKGQVEEALSHYQEKNALSVADNEKGDSASVMLLDSWQKHIQSYDDLKSNIILAHANSTIHDLNQNARDILVERGLLDNRQVHFVQEKKEEKSRLFKGQHVIVTHTDNESGLIGGEQGRVVSVTEETIKLQMNDDRIIQLPAHLRRYVERTRLHDFYVSSGERVLFKKGDRKIGVKNGDIGTVISVDDHQFEARLDSGEVITVPSRYKKLDYAYAMTVHKSQGMSVENTFVCVDTKWWDRALSFVAFTRHKEKLKIFANSRNYPDFDNLVKGLSQKSIADNVIDYPMNLGQRQGFGFDGLIERAVSHVTIASKIIKDKANYLYNYAKALTQQKTIAENNDRSQTQKRAKDIAQYLDMKSKIKVQYDILKTHSSDTGKAVSELNGFDYFYKLSCGRDKKAADLLKMDSELLAGVHMKNFNIEKLKEESARHEALSSVKTVLRLKDIDPARHPELSRKLSTMDMETQENQVLIKQLAKQKNRGAGDMVHIIESYQKHYRTNLLNELKKQSPALDEYIKLTQARQKTASTFEAEKIDKKLSSLAKNIASDQSLSAQIRQHLPKLRNHLNQSIQRGLDRERGIER